MAGSLNGGTKWTDIISGPQKREKKIKTVDIIRTSVVINLLCLYWFSSTFVIFMAPNNCNTYKYGVFQNFNW